MIGTVLLFLSSLSVLCFVRVLLGPTVPDRIAAGDTIGVMLTMVLVLLSVHFRLPVLLDVAMVYAVLQFVDVLILAKYFERGELYR